MNTKYLVGTLIVAGLSTVSNGQIYADFLDDFADVTFFGSGDLTGDLDGGGAFLSTAPDGQGGALGFVTLGWSSGLTTGIGIDIQIFDIGSSISETADVWVSSDGVGFTFVGSINAIDNTLDIDSLYSGAFSYVRVDNTNPNSIIDIDAIAGFYSVPTPGTTVAIALAGLFGTRRRRCSG